MNAEADNEEPSTDPHAPSLLRCPDKHRVDQLDSLLRALEILLFVQYSVEYSSDNSTWLLLSHVLFQNLFVSGGRGPLSSSPPVLPVLFLNVFWIFSHIILPNPQATRHAARGYLHGSIIIDFVGERGPISTWRLLIVDVIIFSLQVFMLALSHEKEKIKQADNQQGTREGDTERDLEAGLLGNRSGREAHVVTGDGIELREINDEEEAVGAHASLLAGATSEQFEDMDQPLFHINILENLQALMQSRSTGDQATSSAIEEAGVLGRVLSRIAVARSEARIG